MRVIIYRIIPKDALSSYLHEVHERHEETLSSFDLTLLTSWPSWWTDLHYNKKSVANHEVHEGHEMEFDQLSNRVIGCAYNQL